MIDASQSASEEAPSQDPMRHKRRRALRLAWGVVVVGLLFVGLAWASRLPEVAVQPSTAMLDTEDTILGRASAELEAANAGLSGVYPLIDAQDAFAARMLLARAAERTLDVQYYIWRQDLTGLLLFEALHQAADRGVRVRLLLDDHNTGGLDPLLAALDAHPQIEVRLFNPFALRRVRTLNFLTDFRRLNRRMHNKSFTADGQATIVGGRNVGDEYFGATDGVLFADLDVLAIGAIVPEVSGDFDLYWNSISSRPLEGLIAAADPAGLETLTERAAEARKDPAASAYMEALAESDLVKRLVDQSLTLTWAPTRMLSDDPAKVIGKAAEAGHLITELFPLVGSAQTSLDLVSPYFVPGAHGTERLAELARQGVRLRILTNSLEATDVAAVQAGYARRRVPLLEAGVRLYELERRNSSNVPSSGPWGSSGSSLHAKTFAVDGRALFVGSFNFDPRSALLNTELGFVIESPELAGQLSALFDGPIPRVAYEVQLTPEGHVRWIDHAPGAAPVLFTHEPNTTFMQRAAVWFLSLLPIEGLL